jgi:hypothetical protein
MFITAAFEIGKGGRNLLTNEWLNRIQSIHRIEYYSTLKKKEIQT